MLKRAIFRILNIVIGVWVFCVPKSEALEAAHAAHAHAPRAPHAAHKEAIDIQSDYAFFDDKKGQAHYKGNVFMSQGIRQVWADTLTIERTKEGNISVMIAEGTTETPARFLITPTDEKPSTQGEAKMMKYFPKEEKIVLLNNAKLIRNENEIQGSSLTYFSNSGILSADAKEDSRTTLILPPKHRGMYE